MVQLRKAPPKGRPAADDLKIQRFAELETAYKMQMRALRAMLQAARGSKQFKARGDKAE